MQNEEKRRRFHGSLLNMLYPPPEKEEDEEKNYEKEAESVSRFGLDADHAQGDELGGSGGFSSSESGEDEEGECGPQKLTRAQRKRLRKKKLKEQSSRRRKIIGPLLPNTGADEGYCGRPENGPQVVRRNDSEESNATFDKPGEPAAGTAQSKMKQRRMARKLARERLKSSTQDCGQEWKQTENNQSQEEDTDAKATLP